MIVVPLAAENVNFCTLNCALVNNFELKSINF